MRGGSWGTIVNRLSGKPIGQTALMSLALFRRLGVLGRGAFGRVIKVERIVDGHVCVIKQVSSGNRRQEEGWVTRPLGFFFGVCLRVAIYAAHEGDPARWPFTKGARRDNQRGASDATDPVRLQRLRGRERPWLLARRHTHARRHPNVIGYIDSFVEDHQLNIVMVGCALGVLSGKLRKAWDEQRDWPSAVRLDASAQSRATSWGWTGSRHSHTHTHRQAKTQPAQ
jgi:hypothetical protein